MEEQSDSCLGSRRTLGCPPSSPHAQETQKLEAAENEDELDGPLPGWSREQMTAQNREAKSSSAEFLS